MRHQVQKGFRNIFVGIPQHQKGYVVYVPSTRKIISSYDVVFDENNYSTLSYSSQTYSEDMYMRPSMSYIHCATYQREQTGDIITFAHFELGDLLSETFDDTEISEKSDENPIMTPLISKEEIDAMDSGDDYDDEPMSMEMLEDIYDSSKSHPSVNRREARYKLCDHIKQGQSEWKGVLLYTQNMGKALHKVFKTVVE